MAPETTSPGRVCTSSGRYSSRAPTHLPRQQDPLPPLSAQIPNRSHDLSSSLKRQDQQEQSPRLPQRARSTRAERSCDTCRRRKLKCVRAAEEARCVLCSFHQRPCTYLDEPQQRRKRRQKQKQQAAASTTTPIISVLLKLSLHHLPPRPSRPTLPSPSASIRQPISSTLALARSTKTSCSTLSSRLFVPTMTKMRQSFAVLRKG